MSKANIVEVLFTMEASEETMAAVKAVKANPFNPEGNSCNNVGYALSDLSIPVTGSFMDSINGRSIPLLTITEAAIPGITTISGINNLRNPAKIIPFCASFKFLAANALWVMYWLNPQ